MDNNSKSRQEAFDEISKHIETQRNYIVMMCGCAGSGKTTFAQRLVDQLGCIRFSIDEEIWQTHGRYGIEYQECQYDQLKKDTEDILKQRLEDLLSKGNLFAVLDYSFWNVNTRKQYIDLIEKYHHNYQIVYLNVSHSELRKRLEIRSNRFDANAAFKISDQLLEQYLSGFNRPNINDNMNVWIINNRDFN
ncbi:hypothetical protein CYY_008432 [Polysphondylium violaceum]|uniref:ATP-binding protein n=1 Tax=Polysphondylium violaceum TaxID=133409 RepID=A0A8J4PQF3_9MYCE|nr:hypothetical protein CYY_008432 [Polysphondylium violaceum]